MLEVGTKVRLSDEFLDNGRAINELWYQQHVDMRGVIVHIEKCGDYQVQWETEPYVCTHPSHWLAAT